ncbi:MAG: zinc ribbon domain-containing protein [Clostridiales Family XIII bacterium]|jgi:uncharacterized OB-fold protein|nr:zinc ribbon domain-containing protein [Clostridiales Family XIII bacterium]
MEKKDIKHIVKTFYNALEEGKILGRKCTKCGHVEFPPYLACNICGNLDTEWHEMSGKAVAMQIMAPSFGFSDKSFRDRVGDYCVGSVKPEESGELVTCFIGVSPGRVDELRGKIPFPVRPIIIQEDGYKMVFWELDE